MGSKKASVPINDPSPSAWNNMFDKREAPKVENIQVSTFMGEKSLSAPF